MVLPQCQVSWGTDDRLSHLAQKLKGHAFPGAGHFGVKGPVFDFHVTAMHGAKTPTLKTGGSGTRKSNGNPCAARSGIGL
jgi:hypothetical protein